MDRINEQREYADVSSAIPDSDHGRRKVTYASATHEPLDTGSHCEVATIHDAFVELARKNPDRIALVSEGQYVSYRVLDVMSLRLAHHLLARDVAREEIVAISAKRSVELVVGILGILKAGCAYLPLDSEYPRDRLLYMLADSGVRLVLTDDDQAGMFRSLNVEEIPLRSEEIAGKKTALTSSRSFGSDALAYLMYTSGSTGQPKGIMVPHQAVLNHVFWRREAFQLDDTDRVLQRTPVSFDISVWEIFGALLSGGALVLPPPGAQKESACLVDEIIKHEITTFQIVPSMLKLMLQEPAMVHCGSLRLVFSGGEVLSGDLVSRLHSSLGAALVNVYGPTETTIDTTFHICSRDMEDNNIPIGRAIRNATAFVADLDGRPALAGEEGMLLVGGQGLARGYWRRAKQTAELFVPDVFGRAQSPGSRVYSTGDIVRLQASGELQFIGRNDSQIKVRGFRIELDEIEYALKSCPLIADGVVIIRPGHGGDKKIVCYYILKNSENSVTLNAVRHTRFHDVREYLVARLPDYMVPHHLVEVDEFPVLPNGKLNARALPEPAYYYSGPREGSKPRNEKEQLLAQVWSEILGAPEIGCDDLFAYYGGDSLQMVQVRLLAQKRGLFINPSLRHHSASVRSIAGAAVWIKDRSIRRRVELRSLARGVKLYLQSRWFELRSLFHQWQTAQLERPERRKFDTFYKNLENKRDIYYLFVREGLLHWLVKQIEFVPEDVNLVIIGAAMTQDEQNWIRTNVKRPFFHSGLEIDHCSAWEMLFETNERSFGWLEIGCFVNNSNLFREMAEIEDDVAFNCVYTHTERHRRTFMEFFLFTNIRAIRSVREGGIMVSPAHYSYEGKSRREHCNGYYRVPRDRDRAMVRRLLREESGESAAEGLSGLISGQEVFRLHLFIGHLFYLYARLQGFRIKRVRHLTAPTHVNYYNFFSDEVILPLHISRYEAVYEENGPKFTRDLEITLQAEYMVLRSMVGRLPPGYAKRLWALEVKILGRGLPLWNAGRNIIHYLVDLGVSEHTFNRPQWSFLKADPLAVDGGEIRVTVDSL